MFKLLSTILIISFFLLSGCAHNGKVKQGVRKGGPEVSGEIVEKLVPWNSESSDSVKILNSKKIRKTEYFQLAEISLWQLTKSCFNGKCKEYKSNADLTGKITEMAKKMGGTHLFIEKLIENSSVARDSGECRQSQTAGREVYTPMNPQNVYSPMSKSIAEYQYCYQWEKEYGQGERIVTKGYVWRHEPTTAKKLMNAKKEDLEKLVPRYFSYKNLSSVKALDDFKKYGIKEKCGYVDAVVGKTVISPSYVVCNPFYSDIAWVKYFGLKPYEKTPSYDWHVIKKDLNSWSNSKHLATGCTPPCDPDDSNCWESNSYKYFTNCKNIIK